LPRFGIGLEQECAKGMRWKLGFGARIYNWYGKHALVYAAGSWLVFLGKEQKLRQRAVEAMGIKKGDTVLDLACGNGKNFALLENAVGAEGQIIAFDYSVGMLDAARSRTNAHNWHNIEFAQGDAAKLNLPANRLDGALCTLGLSAMPDHESAILRVATALKDGARFAVLDAKKFDGFWRIFNPLLRFLFVYTTNWDYRKNIPLTLNKVFGNARIDSFNSGSIFIAVSQKS